MTVLRSVTRLRNRIPHAIPALVPLALAGGLLCAESFPALAQPNAAPAPAKSVTWKDILRQSPEWYRSAEAHAIADNILLYQHDDGGWQKNIDMSAPLSVARKAELTEAKDNTETTIDNGATWTQLRFLGRVVAAAGPGGAETYRTAFLHGIDYLLKAQYPNGGWPQYYPIRKGYYTHITFNDGAMIGVLELLRDMANGGANYGFVDEARRKQAAAAVAKGTDCILKCQIVVKGKKTSWCQQHDETTFAPVPARKFEPAALCSTESAGILRFLMGVPQPSPAIRKSVEAGVDWIQSVRITGLTVRHKPASGTPKGYDTVAEPDPSATSPIWSRYYEIGTNRPIFSGRDSVIRYNLSEIEYERRNGYAWYSTSPEAVIGKEYDTWRRRRTLEKLK